MIVRLSDEAERDMEAIGDWIARDDWQRALTFVQEIRDKCEGLSDFPNRFPLIPRYEERGIRHRVHGSYLIFYRVTKNEVAVVHILHGGTDYADVLFPDGGAHGA